ncbi:hypothetical protein WR25_23926 [Diploscapter pachys]|uniref:[histone H4]-lysine(20) N-methyltransferase n=1 Tax=Diploscapter pachys TaxID=2018661 RepID=A0A2A2JA49_9BILA|nr:hypothetical protein WR25_23926 [Diploscapter pachys]
MSRLDTWISQSPTSFAKPTVTSQHKAKPRPLQRRNGKKPPSVDSDKSCHKITEFFPVRRSSRKTGKQIELEEKDALKEAIYTLANEKHLEVYYDDAKGRGIKARREFFQGEFVCEYKGKLMEYNEAKELEEEYSQDASIGSYMYFFKHHSRRWCVDATSETVYKGRLINHSALRPNLKTKVVEFNGSIHLILIAKRDITSGEELLYDYGDRTPETVAKNPWLINS